MSCVIVVPLYNEERRFKFANFRTFLEQNPEVHFLFVNDGSTDGTGAMLDSLVAETGNRISAQHLPRNQGKAEAVRQGMLIALKRPGVVHAGYFDADEATPLTELPALRSILVEHPHLMMVLGSRVKLLGKKIERLVVRHYLGRIFATVASLVLGIPIYDTQCGAKIFRVTPAVKEIFSTPFRSRWIFDVEIIARLSQATGLKKHELTTLMYEHPLASWVDVGSSRLKAFDFLVAIKDMSTIYFSYRRHLH